MPDIDELQQAEKKLTKQLREIRKFTREDQRGYMGGWNRKTQAEHIANGTYRRDRHGPIADSVLGWRKKPAGLVKATKQDQFKWVRNASDEHAIRNGCKYNEALADYVVDFFAEFLCHSKGQWAGQSFVLNDWQQREMIRPLFGWVRPDGTRRFRRSYIEIAKKNGKSSVASCVGLYMLVGDDEAGAEIWSLGADRDQARVVHNEAVNMVEASEKLAAITKVNHTNFTIKYKATQSFYRAVSATPRGKQGANLHCAIVDELHEWYGTGLWERLRYAFRARQQPLLFVITNAGDDLQSICYRQHEKAKAILTGAIEDDDYFAVICNATQEDAENEIEKVKNGATKLPVAATCNPGLGTIISERDLASDIRDAIHTPSEMPNLLRLTYGVWNTGTDGWLRMTDWADCESDFCEAEVDEWEAMAGLDMSKTGDMTALTLVFRDPVEMDFYRQLAWFWMPEATIADRQHLVDYRGWVDSGHLRIGGDKAIETSIIENDMAEIFERFNTQMLAFDPMFVSESRMAELFPEIEVLKFPQTVMQFAGPTAEYERLVMLNRLEHNGNPVLTWQAGHTCVKCDINKNKRPVKNKAGDIRTIDGIVAGIMALRLQMSNAVEPSDYEDTGATYSAYEAVESG